MVKFVKYFLLTVKSFMKRCKMFYLYKFGKIFYQNKKQLWWTVLAAGQLVWRLGGRSHRASGLVIGDAILVV